MLGIRRPLKPCENGRNIVGCYMLHPFAHPVACCCVLLGVVAQSLKPFKLLSTWKWTQQLPTMLGVVGQPCCVRVFVRGFIQT